MAYKAFKYRLGLYFLAMLLVLPLFGVSISRENPYLIAASAVLFLWLVYRIWSMVTRRFDEITDFFESVKYRDFSRLFNDRSGPPDKRRLHRQFNTVINTIREVNQENTLQSIYLQKVLELADTGIIAYSTRSGHLLWINDSARSLLNVPAFRNIEFLKKRKPDMYSRIIQGGSFEKGIMDIRIEQENLKLLVSDTLFNRDGETIRILALQNLDETLDHTETEAWKKLLSVMTHEIMNSIAPIHSVSTTLEGKLTEQHAHPDQNALEMDDLLLGMKSISKRSEGLMQFAKTYRSLNRVTELNLRTVIVNTLFSDIIHLLEPSAIQKRIQIHHEVSPDHLSLDMDKHLIEQVLINLVKNAMEALEQTGKGTITLKAFTNAKGHTVVQVIDNGSGIPEEIHDKIFVPFYTSKKTGSGIGLSLCKQIMLLHHGKIQVEKTGPEGTTMSLIF